MKMQQTFAGNQDLLDTLWGYYFATGSHLPILRIMADAALEQEPRHRRQADRRQHGALYARKLRRARYGFARISPQRTARCSRTRSRCRSTEVVEAADTVQLGAVRKDALAAVEELKAKGSDSRRNLDFWGQVGVGAVALGCVSAAALGAGRGRHPLRDRRLGRRRACCRSGKSSSSSAVPA